MNAEQSRTRARVLRNLAFALVAVSIVLVALELLARLSGAARYRSNDSPLPFQSLGLPPSAPGPSPDSLVLMPSDGTTGARRTLVAPARKSGFRILTFGGSATYGWGFSPLASFSGKLQKGLLGLSPPVPVEVVNMGVCGWNSTQVRAFLQQALESVEPDLVVIYSGNNEFIDLQALKVAARYYSAETEYLRRRLNRSHLYRLLRAAITPSAPPQPGPAGRPVPIREGLKASLTDEDRAVASWVYHRNLSAMVTSAREHGTPIMLATVADNQRDFCSHGCRVDDPATRAWLEQLEESAGSASAEEVRSRVATAPVSLASEAAQFRLGKVFLELGDVETARGHFEEAERLTRAPQRCTESLRRVVRRVGRETGAAVCDTARLLAARARFGIPGSDLFFDDCHPNAKGHRYLAEILLTCLVEQAMLPPEWEAGAGLDAGLERLATAPRGCPARVDDWDEMAVTPERLPPVTGSWCNRVVAGHHAFAAGRYGRALSAYEGALEAGGPAGPLEFDRSQAARYGGDLEAARLAAEAAVRAMPGDRDAVNLLALVGGSAGE